MLLQLIDVCRYYEIGDNVIKALDHVDFEVEDGEFVAVMGPSGSGKSTFLQVASNLANPSSGKIFLKDKDVANYNEVEKAHLRNREIGFIFQQFNLLPKTKAIDNVALPLVYAGYSADYQYKRAKEMLEKVGLAERLNNTPAQLSGGQQQRVAIARALVNNPSIIFADEPTGNLDTKSGVEIEKILIDLNKEGKTIIMVTHSPEAAKIAKRLVTFRDGHVIEDSKHPHIAKEHAALEAAKKAKAASNKKGRQ